jgi:hypothetical protein
MPNTQSKVVARPDRPLRTNHVVVEGHGAQPEFVNEADFNGHILADKQLNLGDQKRTIKNDAVGERHHVGEAGLDVAKRRHAAIEANKKASAAIFDSDRESVCPTKF